MENAARRTLKLLGYVRVSTRGQAEEGMSLGVQEDRIRAWCDQQGHELVDVIRDGGRSGESLRRPGIREALARLDAGDAVGLVVAKLDRLTRSVEDWCGLVRLRFGPDGPGQELLSCGETVDLSTPSGRMIATIMVAFAQCELETGVVRSATVMAAKQAQGQQLGAIPYGMRLGGDGKTLELNRAEFAVIKQILTWKAEGQSLRTIAQRLNDMGIPPRKGGAWSHSAVGKIAARSLKHNEAEHELQPD